MAATVITVIGTAGIRSTDRGGSAPVAAEAVSSNASCLIDIKQFAGPRKAMVKIYRVRHEDGCGDKSK